MDIKKAIAAEFSVREEYIENIITLIDGGNTIPFIARYRKEMTGSCDDQTLRALADRLAYLRGLEARKAEIKESIASQEKLTPELAAAIDAAATLAEAEDLYRPFRPKKRTRAMVARERGLESLAAAILAQDIKQGSLEELCLPYVDAEKGVETWEDALAGARDIIAEEISEDAALRKRLRDRVVLRAVIKASATKEEDSVYRQYCEYSEPAATAPAHRILAVTRGEREEYLRVWMEFDKETALSLINEAYLRGPSLTGDAVREAGADAWARLVSPSLEREKRAELFAAASEQAIKMFSANLKPLLLYPPIKGKVVLGLDPAYRTGCKIAVVDENGKVLDTAVVYPTPPQQKTAEAKAALSALIKKHGVGAIAIGNGTASKEAEIFVADMIRELDLPVAYMVVSEAGASVYSASKIGAEEFPDYDVSLRSAVSIARRMQDPLAELVKIDPKSIGVGQYQHDMPQARLGEALDGVVEACVNSVGVDLNTASAALLSRISGISSAVAKNIVAYREENGAFAARTELKKVSKLGPKAFEQCAGFLRIPGGKNALDNTSVHPEAYGAAEKLINIAGFNPRDLLAGGIPGISAAVAQKGESELAAECGVGLPTLRDIVGELMKPGRDIRSELPPPLLRTDVLDIKDLKPGMEFMGTVRNVVDFGAFVDIGVHQDGLVHLSELSERYIRHPSEAVKVGDIVKVRVLSVDTQKKRIALTMKKAPQN